MELWFLVLTLFTTSAAIGPLDHASCDALREQFAHFGDVMAMPVHPLCAQAMASVDMPPLHEEPMPSIKPPKHRHEPRYKRTMFPGQRPWL